MPVQVGIGIIILIAIIAALVIIFISARVNTSEKKQKESAEETEINDEPEVKAVGAVVLSKQAVMYSTRHNHSVEFKVIFMTDDGEKTEIKVPQEIYDELHESQAGDLVTINGNFFYFGDGESIE